MKILIADDIDLNLRMLDSTLRRWGHQPHPAADGQEAWQVLDRQYH